MSTQTIAVYNEQDLKDGEMKEVEFGEGGKVLITRLGSKVYATSAYCTHYGAPLAKGTLTADGRVVCPWHGACFNVCTGDIEDAPAPDAIHSFKAEVVGGRILVTAKPSDTQKENKSRFPTLKSTGHAASLGPGVVIVGGGAGALHAIESLRENGYEKSITIISVEPHAPIDRTKLSKALITDVSKVQWRSLSELQTKYGATFRTGVTVTGVNTQEKYVVTEAGDKVSYEHLILATGGTPRRLPIPGFNSENVFTFRHVHDAQKIDAAVTEGKRLVVLGSSFISMELVVAVSKRKLASIDVIAMENYPFERVLGVEIGKILKKFHEQQGINFHPSAMVKNIRVKPNTSIAEGVELDGGAYLPADVIVAGVGVVPATAFLKESGIPLERDGGVKVDEFLRVPNVENVYAVGDIAVYPEKTLGDMRRIEHWNVASNHGRAVGRTIVGKGEPFNKIPIFWSSQGQQLRYAGNGVGYEDVIFKGDPSDSMKFVAYYTKGDRVIAVASMQSDPVVTQCSELMRLGKMPSASEIKAGKDPLSVNISSISPEETKKA